MTGLTTPLNEDMQALSDEHREWLSQFDSRYSANWGKLFEADNEAAMAEASVLRQLQHYGITVEPNEDLDTSKQAPDFRCERSGIKFFVEVSCIHIATAEKVTGIPNDTPYQGGFRPLNLAVFNKCIVKARQASSVDGPVLVAIGTWHGFAAMQFKKKPIVNMLLTGETKMTWDINIKTGEQSETNQTTNLYPAIFLKPDADKNPIPARESISGVLLCAFGMPEIKPLVVLNPNASRPFDSSALPKLEYGSVVVDQEQQQLIIEWQTSVLPAKEKTQNVMTDPLTPEEKLKLRAFHRQFDRIRQSSIGKAGKVRLSKKRNFNLATGEITTSFSGYDPEQFQSQLPLLRQFVLQDSINFGHVCNIIYQKCDREELKAWIAEARKRWQENLERLPGEIDRHLHQVTTSVEDALEKLFYGYGGLFHVDINAPEEEQAVKEIETSLLHQVFPKLCWCLNVVDSVIYWWLDAPDESVPSPTKAEEAQTD